MATTFSACCRAFAVSPALAAGASALFARNLANFLTAFWDKDSGAPLLPEGDEIVAVDR